MAGDGQWDGNLQGRNLHFRFARPDDAAYIYDLRVDARYNQHLSPPPPSADAQRAWLEGYVSREAAGLEYYFVIEHEGAPCGVVRLYQIQGDQFTWGSWILDSHKPPKAALESALMVYDIAFDRLGKARAVFDVRRDNERVLAFHRRFGARQTGIDEQDVFFELTAADYARVRANLWAAVPHRTEPGEGPNTVI